MSVVDPNSSLNVIGVDSFRAIRRRRQLFQRKFTRLEGDPGDRSFPGFPQFRHGSIRLTALFNKPAIVE